MFLIRSARRMNKSSNFWTHRHNPAECDLKMIIALQEGANREQSKEQQRRHGKGNPSSLGGTAILLTTVTILLYLLKYYVIAAIVGTTAALAIVGMALALTWFIASHWTIKTMSAGAEIALRSQEINDQWDAKKNGSAWPT